MATTVSSLDMLMETRHFAQQWCVKHMMAPESFRNPKSLGWFMRCIVCQMIKGYRSFSRKTNGRGTLAIWRHTSAMISTGTNLKKTTHRWCHMLNLLWPMFPMTFHILNSVGVDQSNASGSSGLIVMKDSKILAS